MKATVPLAELKRIVDAARRAVGPAIARPVLGGVHLDLADGHLTATGTDLDLTISATTEVGGGDPGVAVIPARHIAAVLGRLKATEVTIDATDGEAVITGGRSVTRLRCLDPTEWPRLPAPEGEPQALTEDEWDSVGRVAVAASLDQARPAICGISFRDGRVAGTDGYRLHMADVPDGLDALIPARAITEVRRRGTEVTITTGDNLAHLDCGQLTVTTRLIADDFPMVARLMEGTDDHALGITTEAGDLLDAIALAATIEGTGSDGKPDGNPVRLTVADGAVIIDKVGIDVGDVRSTIDATLLDGTVDIVIGYSPVYLSDAIEAVAPEGGRVTIRWADNKKPSRLSGAGVDACLMPVRIPT